jgi:hypothetical protein
LATSVPEELALLMVSPGLDIPALAHFLTHNRGSRGQQAVAVRERVIVLLGSRGVLPEAVTVVLRLKVEIPVMPGKIPLLAIHEEVVVVDLVQSFCVLLEVLPVVAVVAVVAL